MGNANCALRIAAVAILLAAGAEAADKRNEFKFNAGSGAKVTITNPNGPVTVKSGAGRQVLIVATTHSDKATVEANQYANRIDARTQSAQRGTADEMRVDYEVTMPAGVDLTVHGGNGNILVERVRADVELESESGRVEVRDVPNSHVHVRTVTGPVSLSAISNGHVEVTTVSGDVTLKAVTGPHLNVNAGKGSIYYAGDFAGAGEYTLINNSGNIEVTVPANASISLKAHSIRGSVENDLALQAMPGAPQTSARSLVGTSNAGASSVDLRSFSGKIRVKKN
jgi:DUF4097 and DUF4098 domain-containing protein YvlB